MVKDLALVMIMLLFCWRLACIYSLISVTLLARLVTDSVEM